MAENLCKNITINEKERLKMAVYNSTSKKAEEFINHEQILKTLEYAGQHKDDRGEMELILEKGRKYQGLHIKRLLRCWSAKIPI